MISALFVVDVSVDIADINVYFVAGVPLAGPVALGTLGSISQTSTLPHSGTIPQANGGDRLFRYSAEFNDPVFPPKVTTNSFPSGLLRVYSENSRELTLYFFPPFNYLLLKRIGI